MKWIKILKALKRNERSLKKRADEVERVCRDLDNITFKLLAK